MEYELHILVPFHTLFSLFIHQTISIYFELKKSVHLYPEQTFI